jgi:hypothetical protein
MPDLIHRSKVMPEQTQPLQLPAVVVVLPQQRPESTELPEQTLILHGQPLHQAVRAVFMLAAVVVARTRLET